MIGIDTIGTHIHTMGTNKINTNVFTHTNKVIVYISAKCSKVFTYTGYKTDHRAVLAFTDQCTDRSLSHSPVLR